MIAQNSEVYNPPTYRFSLYTYMEKDLCRGVVYFTVLCDHPYLVSLLFAVLVSLHPGTFRGATALLVAALQPLYAVATRRSAS